MSLDDEFTLDSIPSDVKVSSKNTTSYDGLSVEEVMNKIAIQNKTIVAPDDPILIQVTILNAFIDEFKRVNEKSQNALKAIYRVQADSFQEEIELVSSSIAKSLKEVSLEELTKLYGRLLAEVERLRSYIFFASTTIALSAIIHLALFILA